MKKVTIQNNVFFCEQLATTQEGNFGQILDKWNLYKELKSEPKLVGKLVKYMNGTFQVFHDYVIYKIYWKEINFDLSKDYHAEPDDNDSPRGHENKVSFDIK